VKWVASILFSDTTGKVVRQIQCLIESDGNSVSKNLNITILMIYEPKLTTWECNSPSPCRRYTPA
jgi:hypothetical protein